MVALVCCSSLEHFEILGLSHSCKGLLSQLAVTSEEQLVQDQVSDLSSLWPFEHLEILQVCPL
jgi:hypothetical protein